MSDTPTIDGDADRRCIDCGWTQATGSGQFVITCPVCGGSSWGPQQ